MISKGKTFRKGDNIKKHFNSLDVRLFIIHSSIHSVKCTKYFLGVDI